MPTKIIQPNKVTVHFECCECHAKSKCMLNDLVDLQSVCDECDNMENFVEIIGVSIKEPKIKKNIKLKKECFTCKTFDKKQRSACKCAVQNSCPGLNWSEKRKQRAIEREAFSKLWGGKSKC